MVEMAHRILDNMHLIRVYIKTNGARSGLLAKMESRFSQQWLFRLSVVLQVVGYIGLMFLMAAGGSDYWVLGDLFNGHHWSGGRYGGHENWAAMFFVFGPFLSTKAVDWVIEATD